MTKSKCSGFVSLTPYTATKAGGVSFTDIKIFVDFKFHAFRLRELFWRCLKSEKNIYFIDIWGIQKVYRRRKFGCYIIRG